MTIQVRTFSGLFLDANPHGSVPEGAMDEANNVEINRAGLIGPRQGFHRVSTAKTAVQAMVDDIQRSVLVPGGGDLLVMSDTTVVNWDGNDETEISIAGVTAEPVQFLSASTAVTRQRLYAATQAGIAFYNDASNSMIRIGYIGQNMNVVPNNIVAPFTATGKVWFLDNNFVAYRVSAERIDPESGAVIAVSPPSPRMVIENTSGASAAITVRIQCAGNSLHSNITVARDRICLWRSFQSLTDPPSDEMFLVARFFPTVSTSFTYLDRVADEELGPDALYTNPSQESLALQNIAPPLGKIVFEYQGSLFSANIIGDWRLPIQWEIDADSLYSASATGIGRRTYTGTTTIGSPIITVLSSTVGLEVGQAVFTVGIGLPLHTTFITVVGAGQVTVSQNSTANFTGSIDFYDVVRIDDGDGNISNHRQDGPFNFWKNVNNHGSTILSDIETFSRKAAYHVGSIDNPQFPGTAGIGVTFGPGFGNMILAVTATTGTNPPLVWATHGSEYNPVLPGVASAGKAMTRAIEPALVAYSKRFEPEHFVSGGQQFFVGDHAKEILGGLVASNVAYVFKTDGIFTVTGAGANSGFRLDPLDSSYRLMTSRHLCEADGAAVAWTDRGVIMIHPGGQIEHISEGRLDEILELAIPGNAYDGNMIFDERKDVIVMCLRSDAESYGPYTLIYSTTTKTWVTRTLGGAEVIHSAGPMPVSFGGDTNIGHWTLARRAWRVPEPAELAEPWQEQCDFGSQGITISSVVGNTIVYTNTALVYRQALVGDIIFDDPFVGIITAVTVTGALGATVEVAVVAGTVPAGVAQLWYRIEAAFRLRPNSDADLAAWKIWTMLQGTLEAPMRLRSMTFSVSSNRVGAEQAVAKLTKAYDIDGTQPAGVHRMLVGQAHAHSTHLSAGFEVLEAGALWKMSGLTLVGDAISREVR